MKKLVLSACLLLYTLPVWAKDAGQAVADMQSVSDTDPNGFKWMIVCIGLLFLMAGSLIVATIVYGMQQKKNKENREQARAMRSAAQSDADVADSQLDQSEIDAPESAE